MTERFEVLPAVVAKSGWNIADFEEVFANWFELLKERVEQDYHQFLTSRNMFIRLSVERGGRFIKIVQSNGPVGSDHRSVYGFVDKKTGNVLKAAGWKSPAKNFARGHIFEPFVEGGEPKPLRYTWTGIQ